MTERSNPLPSSARDTALTKGGRYLLSEPSGEQSGGTRIWVLLTRTKQLGFVPMKLPLTIRLLALVFVVTTSGCVTGNKKHSGDVPSSIETKAVNFRAAPGPIAVGRTVATEDGGVRFSWSGTGATLRFRGTTVAADMTEGGSNQYLVLIDGVPSQAKINPEQGRSIVTLARNLNEGEHTVTLYKLTEPLVGTATLHGFVIEAGGDVLPIEPPNSKRIEILGDSISAGYGNEGTDETCGFSPETENHYLTYGAIAARQLGARLSTIAWSGKGVFSNRGSTSDKDTLPVLWDQALPQEKVAHDFSEEEPDAVVINLGTNDFAPEVPDFSPFGPAFDAFVETVRTKYRKAHIFIMMGPLLTDGYPEGRQAYTKARAALTALVERRVEKGDTQLHFFEVERATAEEGFGCDWHPSAKTHERMAKALVEQLKAHAGF